MDYNLKEQPIFSCGEILSTSISQPVDLDFTLPDYCVDIENILKCSMCIKVFSHSLSAGELRIDGVALIRILYTDKDKKALRCYEQNHSFATASPVSGEIGECIVDINPKSEYLNCRALTPRRLSVHGAFSLDVKITTRDLCSLYSLDTPCDLQTKDETLEISEVKLFEQERINITDVVAFKARKAIETIVRTDLSVAITEQSHSGDRFFLSGELTLRMLYISDASTGEVDQYVCVYPFKETVRTAMEECDVSYVSLNISTFDVTLKSEAMSDEPLIQLEASILADIYGYKNIEGIYITDAYSVDYDTECKYECFNLSQNVRPISVNSIEKQRLSLGDKQIQKIIDIFADTGVNSGMFKENTLDIGGKVDVSILALTMDEELVIIDRQIDIAHSQDFDKAYNSVKDLNCKVTSLSYRLGDSSDIELRLEITYSCLLSDNISVKEIKTVSKLSDTVKDKDKTPLVLYYASAGEKVWDISKRYNTFIDTLREENSLSCDELPEDKMLMIFGA